MTSNTRPARRRQLSDRPGVRFLRTLFGLGNLAPALFARWAERLWFTVPRFATPTRERPWEERAQIEFVDSPHGPIATYQWGQRKAPAIVLLHGWAGRATQMCAFIDPLLAAGYQVIAVDAPAHGRSPGRQTNLFEIVDALAVVDARFGPFAGAIAHSFGVPSCMLALHEKRLRCQRLVGISPPFDLAGMLDKFCDMLNIPNKVKQRIRARISDRLGTHVWERLRMDRMAPQLCQPALIVHDAKDREVPLSEGRLTAEAWPHARLHITRGLGHRRILRAPEVTAAAVAFLSERAEESAPDPCTDSTNATRPLEAS